MTLDDRAKPPLGLLLILGALTAFAPMSIDMYLPALPQIGRDLHASSAAAQMTVSAFFAGLACGQLVYGPLSDRVGRRGPILFGIALFLAATVACAFATSAEALIAARLVQALGGCAGVVVARAVVRDRFHHQESARIFSLLMLIMGVAPILAPLIGGWVLEAAGWRAIFWILFGFGGATGLAVLLSLPESRSTETAEKARGESVANAYAAILSNPGAMGYILVGALSSSAMFTYIATSPAMLIDGYGVAPSNFGWIFGANAAGIIGASQLNRLLLRRYRADGILRVGLAGAGVAAVALIATAFSGFGGMIGVLIPLFFCVALHGLGTPNAVAGALAMDPQRAGSVSGLLGFAQFGVGAAASALAGRYEDGSPHATAAVIGLCLFGANLIFWLLLPAKRGDGRAPVQP